MVVYVAYVYVAYVAAHMWQRICGSLYLAAHKLVRDKGHVGVAVSAQAGFELDMVQYFKVSIQPIQ